MHVVNPVSLGEKRTESPGIPRGKRKNGLDVRTPAQV